MHPHGIHAYPSTCIHFQVDWKSKPAEKHLELFCERLPVDSHILLRRRHPVFHHFFFLQGVEGVLLEYVAAGPLLLREAVIVFTRIRSRR